MPLKAMPSDSPVPVALVVAMRAEAEPLVQALGLQWVSSRPFPVARGERGALVVSGVGRVRCAAATSFLFATLGGDAGWGKECPWVNVGVAGHGTAEVGTVLLAHKIEPPPSYGSSGRNRFPPRILELPQSGEVSSTVVRTVDLVERSYQEDVAYEMEASAFCEIAGQFSTAELVQVIKIVSDNPTHPVEEISEQSIRSLVASRIEPVVGLLDSLSELAEEWRRREVPAEWLEPFLHWRFTVSQQRQLVRWLERFRALDFPTGASVFALVSECVKAKEVLVELERQFARSWQDRNPS